MMKMETVENVSFIHWTVRTEGGRKIVQDHRGLWMIIDDWMGDGCHGLIMLTLHMHSLEDLWREWE